MPIGVSGEKRRQLTDGNHIQNQHNEADDTAAGAVLPAVGLGVHGRRRHDELRQAELKEGQHHVVHLGGSEEWWGVV